MITPQITRAMARERRWAEDGKPQAWRPEVAGDQIAGEVIDTFEVTGEYSTSPVAVLELEDGTEQTVFFFGAILGQEFRRQGVRLGDFVAVTFGGLGRTKDGSKPLKRFSLKVLGRTAPVQQASFTGGAVSEDLPHDEPPADERIPWD